LNTGIGARAAALKWDDIDFDKRTMKIQATSTSIKERDENNGYTGKYKTVEQDSVKTASSHRILPLNVVAIETLKSLQLASTGKYVISTKTGHMLKPYDLNRSFGRILNNAGISGEYGVHSLRHTFATILFGQGVDIKIVSKLLGHQSIRITYDTYVHVLAELEVQAIEAIPNL